MKGCFNLYYVLQEYKPLTRIMTCDYFLTHSSTSIKRPQPPFGHPNESFVCCYLKQPCIKRLIHILWLYFKNTMKENTVRDRSWHVWAYALCIMALGWGVMALIIIRLQLVFILFCFAFFLPAFFWLAPVWRITSSVLCWNNVQKNNFLREKLSDLRKSVFASYSRLE